MVDIIKCHSFLTIPELNEPEGFALFSTIGKVDEVPIGEVLLVFDLLVDIGIPVSVQISISVSGQSVNTAITGTNPGCQVAIT